MKSPSPAPYVFREGKKVRAHLEAHRVSPYTTPIFSPQNKPALTPHSYTNHINYPYLNALINRTFPGLGSPIAAGAYGSIYRIFLRDGEDVLAHRMASLHKFGKDVVEGNLTDPQMIFGKWLALKVQVARNKSRFQELRRDWKHEAQVHRYVNRQLPGLAPEMLFAAVDPEYNVHYTLMEFVEGTPLSKIEHVTPQLAQRVEAAVTSLWKIGIAHADLHRGNVLVKPDGSIVIIDFGMAELLTQNMVKSLRPTDSADEMWSKIEHYVEGRKRRQGLAWYNPNGKLIRLVHHMARDHSPTGITSFDRASSASSDGSSVYKTARSHFA